MTETVTAQAVRSHVLSDPTEEHNARIELMGSENMNGG